MTKLFVSEFSETSQKIEIHFIKTLFITSQLARRLMIKMFCVCLFVCLLALGFYNPVCMKGLWVFKGERNLKAYCASKSNTLQTMNFDTNLIKIDGELWNVMDN